MLSRSKTPCSWFVVLLIAIVLSSSEGCGGRGNERVDVYPVSGTVMFERVPAAGVVLQLIPEHGSIAAKENLKPGGVTDERGHYDVMTYATGDGAPAGSYKLILFWPPEMDADPMAELTNNTGRGKAKTPPMIPDGPPDRFAGKYFDAKKTEWSVNVAEQEVNEIPTIQL